MPRILVIEDEKSLRVSISRMLTRSRARRYAEEARFERLGRLRRGE